MSKKTEVNEAFLEVVTELRENIKSYGRREDFNAKGMYELFQNFYSTLQGIDKVMSELQEAIRKGKL